MDKYDSSQLTEFPRFESESSQSGVTSFFNKFWKLPLFSPSESNDNTQNKPQGDSKVQVQQTEDQTKPDYDDKLETGSYAVEFEGRSLHNVLRRISSLVASKSSGGTRYADTELAQYWMPDDISRECYECASRFSTLRRRHHCRVCGQIFCSRCCSQRVPGQIFGCAGGLRVCNYCCNVVLSYLRENDMSGDISPDLRTLQENLQVKFPENKTIAQSEDKFVFAREQEVREPRAAKEALQDTFRRLTFMLPTQQHRFRLNRYNGVWRGNDILQWIMDNTNNKTRVQASMLCQSMLAAGLMECCTELAQFADYALYKPVELPPPVAGRDDDSPQQEESSRLVESVSSYCLDLNLGESSARLTKTAKAESQASPSSGDETPSLPDKSEEGTESRKVCKAIAELGEDHLKLLLRQCLAREGLSSSWLETLYPLCQQASEAVVLDVFSNDIDIRNYVQVKKVPGGNMSDSCVINGVVITKNVAHRGMPQQLYNPTVLLLDCSIAYQRVEGKLTSLEPVLMQEKAYLLHCAARISALRPNVVLVKGSAARAVQDVLRNEGVALAVGVGARALGRVARCSRADVITSVDARIGLPRLGLCRSFRVDTGSSKTLMVLENCPDSRLGCSILLKGPSLPELVKVKKVAKFMLLACYNWKLETAFLSDMEAVIPEPGMTFDEAEPSDGQDRKTAAKTEDGQQRKSYRKTESDKNFSCGVPIRDFSDPLRAKQLDDEVFQPQETVLKADVQNDRWSMDDVVLSMSPNLVINAPYLETEAGRKCHLRKYFPQPLFPSRKQHAAMTPKTRRRVSRHCELTPVYKEVHVFVRDVITSPAEDGGVRASLAQYRATGCRVPVDDHLPGCPQYKPTVLRKKPKETQVDVGEREKEIDDYLDPLNPENHQRLSLLFYSFSNKSANVPDFCVNPWIMTMEMYGRRDISLGAFLEQYCFNCENKCPSTNCQVPMNQHVRRFVHGDVCITITCNTIGHSSADKRNEEQTKQVMFWSLCATCGHTTRPLPLQPRARCLSLCAYISLRVRTARHLRAHCAHCAHPPHARNHYFASRLTTACFKYSKITTWDIELPPDVITIKYDTKSMRDALINQLNELMLKGHELFSAITDSEAEKDHLTFKQHMEQLHIALTSTSLQEQTSLAGVVRSLWAVADKIISGEKMLRDAQEKWSSPAKPGKTTDVVEEKSDLEDSGTGDPNNENTDLLTKDEIDRGAEEDEEKGDKKTVKQILSQLLSNNQPSNQSGMIISHGLVPVVVFAAEIGSVIAATLASVTYQRSLHALFSNQSEQEESETTSSGRDKTDSDKSKAAKSNDHIEVLLKDSLLCRVYYAAQFHKLRHLLVAPLTNNPHITDEFARTSPNKPEADCCQDEKCDSKSLCDIEEGFIRSLAQCEPWAACGGKSGSTFCKTKDDRYVLKEMTKPEWQQFLEFAPHYFNYVIACHQNNLPTLLARILGVFSVGGAGSGVLVMENLLYACAPHGRRYDLKGAARPRSVSTSTPDAAAEPRVLADENMLLARWETQLYLPSHTAQVLSAAVERDTSFLASQCVMDYSLLLGIENNRLYVGIIDYIRTFTWDKKVEHYVKKNLRPGQPTVVSPQQYKLRFSAAMAKYFPQCPDHWDHLVAGLGGHGGHGGHGGQGGTGGLHAASCV